MGPLALGSCSARSRWRCGNSPDRHQRGKGVRGVSLDQKRARWFGVLYLITFVTSIPALALYETVLRHPVSYIAGAGHDKQVLLGALLELLLIIANIGTAVVIFPILRRLSEELALGYVTARLVECTFILVGIVSMLGIITLRNQVAGPSEGTVAYTLAAIKDWTFLLGPGWVVGWGNGLILGYLMYRSGLVPRRATGRGREVDDSRRHQPEPPAALAASHRHHPGVRVGTLPRRLLHRLGFPAGCSDPFRECSGPSRERPHSFRERGLTTQYASTPHSPDAATDAVSPPWQRLLALSGVEEIQGCRLNGGYRSRRRGTGSSPCPGSQKFRPAG